MNNPMNSNNTTHPINVIQTHPGVFHADEVFGTAIVQLIYPDAAIIRRGIKPGTAPEVFPGHIYLDVGGVYDPEKGMFDHHQADFNLCYPDSHKYATAGIIWKHFGLELTKGCNKSFQTIASWIQSNIDAPDVGGKITGVTEIFSAQNPTWNSDKSFDDCFLEALELAKTCLRGMVNRAVAGNEGNELVSSTLAAVPTTECYAFFEKFVPWSSHDIPSHIHFVIHPAAQGRTGFVAQAVPSTPGGRDQRTPFPAEWGGQKPDKIKELSGLEGITFCHVGQFIVAAEKKEQAIKAAKKAKRIKDTNAIKLEAERLKAEELEG